MWPNKNCLQSDQIDIKCKIFLFIAESCFFLAPNGVLVPNWGEKCENDSPQETVCEYRGIANHILT